MMFLSSMYWTSCSIIWAFTGPTGYGCCLTGSDSPTSVWWYIPVAWPGTSGNRSDYFWINEESSSNAMGVKWLNFEDRLLRTSEFPNLIVWTETSKSESISGRADWTNSTPSCDSQVIAVITTLGVLCGPRSAHDWSLGIGRYSGLPIP